MQAKSPQVLNEQGGSPNFFFEWLVPGQSSDSLSGFANFQALGRASGRQLGSWRFYFVGEDSLA